jgi:hypothetical protein
VSAPPVDLADIWSRRRRLQKERDDFIRAATAEFDVGYRERMRALLAECAPHAFSERGEILSTGRIRFLCTRCGLYRYEPD